MAYTQKKQLTHEEIEKLVAEAFPAVDSRCTVLCAEFRNLEDTLQDPDLDLTPEERHKLLIRVHAISVQIRQLHCRCPPPQ
jgi:hypothetical protein